MSRPLVSVLMTVYNAGPYLDASIRSIVDQSFRDWEFLIVDDASTDASAGTAAEWAKRDPRIRLIPNAANKGQTPCLNQGLREAKGEWIARQDADDLSRPERFARQLATVGDSALIGTNGWIIDAQDRVIGLLDAPVTHESIAWTSPFLNPFMHTAVMVRTSVIREELGGYDESFRIAQDYDLWTRLLARHRTKNLADRLVCYRHLATSLSKAGSGTAFSEARRVAEREAARVFGRTLQPAELELLASFRAGLDGANRKPFWRLYRELRADRPVTDDFRRTMALHHLKAAGAVGQPAMAAEILSAALIAPGVTFRWLADRLAAGTRRG